MRSCSDSQILATGTCCRPSLQSAESIKERLYQAKLEGNQRKRRIQVPCFVVAVWLGLLSLGALALARGRVGGLWLLSVSIGLRNMSVSALLLTLLPTSNRAIRWAARVAVGVGFILLGSIALVTWRAYLARDRLGAVSGLALALLQACCISAVAGALWDQKVGHLLERLWRIWGCHLSGEGCVKLIVTMTRIALCGCFDPIELWDWASAAVCLLLAGLVHSRCYTRVQAWLASKGGRVATAASIAALIEDSSAHDLVLSACTRFRYVTLDKVKEEEMAKAAPDPGLHDRSRPARLQEIDAFVSHSWHDDSKSKWAALQEWRAEFKLRNRGKEPKVWIDKYCIDQRDIEANISSLPIYMAGCRTLLLLVGDTYLTRIWCTVELFVFMAMGGKPDRITLRRLQNQSPHSIPLECSPDHDASGAWQDLSSSIGLRTFDVRRADCHLATDKERLVGMILGGFGGPEAFNQAVRSLFADVAARADALNRPVLRQPT